MNQSLGFGICFVVTNSRVDTTKPYADQPFAAIASNGTWTCDITTGGQDQTATQTAVFLVPRGTPARVILDDATLPAQIYADAVDHKDVTRLCSCLAQ